MLHLPRICFVAIREYMRPPTSVVCPRFDELLPLLLPEWIRHVFSSVALIKFQNSSIRSPTRHRRGWHLHGHPPNATEYAMRIRTAGLCWRRDLLPAAVPPLLPRVLGRSVFPLIRNCYNRCIDTHRRVCRKLVCRKGREGPG